MKLKSVGWLVILPWLWQGFEIRRSDNGNIKEKGTHDELMKENGAYKILYDLQFRDSETHEDEKLASELKITN